MITSVPSHQHAWVRKSVLFIALALLLPTGLSPSPASAAGVPAKSYADIAVDRSTPEQHLATFMTAVERSIIRMEARDWARGFHDAWLHSEITEEQSAEIGPLKRCILEPMDLSGFPEWQRESTGMETTLMLWAILNTYIQVGTFGSGMRMGDVVFTADTIASVPDLCQTVISRKPEGFDPYRYYTETPGGLAFALAAKPTLNNILAGVILFLDGSIEVGDAIESGDPTGRIANIGMRPTRVRSLDGGLIRVTNSELADKFIKNVSHRVLLPQRPVEE